MKKMQFSLFFLLLLFCKTLVAQQKTTQDTVYNIVDQAPNFNGNLTTYLRNHLHYPDFAFNKNIEGTAYISFIVTKTGEITDVKIEKSLSPDLDSTAVAVITTMPKWKPGKQNGKEVNVRCHLPIKFTVDKTGNAPKETYVPRIFCNLKGFYIAPYAGTGVSTIFLNKGQTSFSTESGSYFIAYTGGSQFGYMFNNHSGIFLGIEYQNYKNNYSFEHQFSQPPPIPESYSTRPNSNSPNDTEVVASINVAITYSFSYLQTPILFRYISSNPGKAGLDLESGIIMGFLTNATESGNIDPDAYYYTKEPSYNQYIWEWAYTPSPFNTGVNPVSKVGNANKLSIGLVENIGVNVPLTNSLSLILGIMDTYLLSSIGNGGQDIITYSTGVKYNYFVGNYGKPNSIIFNPNLIIRLGKSDYKPPQQSKN